MPDQMSPRDSRCADQNGRAGDTDQAVTCDPGNCGFISVPGASQVNAVCCFSGICEYHTTCVESRQLSSDDEATPDLALVWCVGYDSCLPRL